MNKNKIGLFALLFIVWLFPVWKSHEYNTKSIFDYHEFQYIILIIICVFAFSLLVIYLIDNMWITICVITGVLIISVFFDIKYLPYMLSLYFLLLVHKRITKNTIAPQKNTLFLLSIGLLSTIISLFVSLEVLRYSWVVKNTYFFSCVCLSILIPITFIALITVSFLKSSEQLIKKFFLNKNQRVSLKLVYCFSLLRFVSSMFNYLAASRIVGINVRILAIPWLFYVLIIVSSKDPYVFILEERLNNVFEKLTNRERR